MDAIGAKHQFGMNKHSGNLRPVKELGVPAWCEAPMYSATIN